MLNFIGYLKSRFLFFVILMKFNFFGLIVKFVFLDKIGVIKIFLIILFSIFNIFLLYW